MKEITKDEVNALINQVGAYTDGNNFAIVGGCYCFTLDCAQGKDTTFIVEKFTHPDMSTPQDLVPFHEMQWLQAWVFDSHIEAAAFYAAQLIAGAPDCA